MYPLLYIFASFEDIDSSNLKEYLLSLIPKHFTSVITIDRVEVLDEYFLIIDVLITNSVLGVPETIKEVKQLKRLLEVALTEKLSNLQVLKPIHYVGNN